LVSMLIHRRDRVGVIDAVVLQARAGGAPAPVSMAAAGDLVAAFAAGCPCLPARSSDGCVQLPRLSGQSARGRSTRDRERAARDARRRLAYSPRELGRLARRRMG